MKWIRQSNAKDGRATDKIIEDRIKVIFLSTVHNTVLKVLLTCYCW